MTPVYIPYAGDLYELVIDHEGNIVSATVRRDNRSRPPEPIKLDEIPNWVLNEMVNKLLRQIKDRT